MSRYFCLKQIVDLLIQETILHGKVEPVSMEGHADECEVIESMFWDRDSG